jgi:hypothetical protein
LQQQELFKRAVPLEQAAARQLESVPTAILQLTLSVAVVVPVAQREQTLVEAVECAQVQ